MSRNTGALLLLLLLSFSGFVTLGDAVHSLVYLRRSKSKIRKDDKLIPWYKKLLLTGYWMKWKHHDKLARALCISYWCLIAIVLIGVILYTLSLFFPLFENIFWYFAIGEICIIDLSGIAFGLLTRGHDKNRNNHSDWIWKL